MKIIETTDINKFIQYNQRKFISESEQSYKEKLKTIAQQIFDNAKQKPIVLLSGPSGSGKTTTALKLSKILCEMGVKSHTISMDDYFLPLNKDDNFPKLADGSIDLESPYRIDIPLLKEHITKLFKYEEINIPTYDFITSDRSGYTPLKREKDEIIIIEGIHALNPLITGECTDFCTYGYVSVRTRIENTNLDRLHPRLIRLMRRLSRDLLFRGREIQDTFKMFKSVSRGEETYIMKFKTLADFDIDTFMSFEASAYKSIIFDKLNEKSDIMAGDFDYDMIVEFLSDIEKLNLKFIPNDSLIREFIGH